MAAGIKSVKRQTDADNSVNFVYEYSAVSELSEPCPIKVEFIPSESSEVTLDTTLHGVDQNNLTTEEAEIQTLVQNLPEIITIEDSDTESIEELDRVMAQDLQNLEETHLGIDSETVELINLIKKDNDIHLGTDKDTLALAAQLQKEEDKKEELQQSNNTEQLDKNDENFPLLPQATGKS